MADVEQGERKLHVVTLVNRLTRLGGAEQLAMEVSMRLDPMRFERTLCVTRPERADQGAADELEAAGVRLLRLERRGSFHLTAWWPLVAFLRRKRVDVIHAHMFSSNLWGTLIGRLAGVPVIVAHEHTWSFEGQPLRRFLDRNVIGRGSDALLAVSGEDRRRMIDVERLDPDDVRLLPNGITPLPPVRHDVRAELGIAPGDPVLGTVAVLRPQKALDDLVRAVAQLITEFPRLRVLIAGDGQERGSLERLARELGVAGAVSLLGPRNDVPDVLAALDITVSSSRFEGSPLAIMEYMAAAKPVVATRVGGVPDLIEDGTHGLLVEPRDPDALAQAIGRLLRDPAEARRMGAQGRERQRQEFDLDVMVGRIEALYLELLAGTRRNGPEWR